MKDNNMSDFSINEMQEMQKAGKMRTEKQKTGIVWGFSQEDESEKPEAAWENPVLVIVRGIKYNESYKMLTEDLHGKLSESGK